VRSRFARCILPAVIAATLFDVRADGATESIVWYEVTLNGVSQGIEALRVDAGGEPCIPIEALTRWRLRETVAKGRDCVRPAEIPGARVEVDSRKLRLAIDVPAAAFAEDRIDLRGKNRPSMLREGFGAFLTYDLTAFDARAHGYDESGVGGLFSMNAFRGAWTASSELVARSQGFASRVVRLDTRIIRDDPANLATLTLGDAIGHSGSWGRSVRFAGIGYGSNFGLRDDFVPFPLPAFHGESALPTTAELFINGERRESVALRPGPFQLADLPAVSGAGEARLVTRDLLGRQQVVTLPFYATQALLRPGLSDYQVEAGFVRRDFGLASNDYGKGFASVNYRYGMTPSWTFEARGEAHGDAQTLGVGSRTQRCCLRPRTFARTKRPPEDCA